jgi:hypothetical protein
MTGICAKQTAGVDVKRTWLTAALDTSIGGKRTFSGGRKRRRDIRPKQALIDAPRNIAKGGLRSFRSPYPRGPERRKKTVIMQMNNAP